MKVVFKSALTSIPNSLAQGVFATSNIYFIAGYASSYPNLFNNKLSMVIFSSDNTYGCY